MKSLLNRKITSYAKVQRLISSFRRGRKVFINRKRIKKLRYLDIGCGPNINSEFVNLDYEWRPGIDVCWDLSKKPLPFKDGQFKGVYSEHCFEHLSFEDFRKNMKEIHRVLENSGMLRLIMPDGELYLDIYQKKKSGEDMKMPWEDGYISPMHRINGIFRNHGHLFIYDFSTIKIILEQIGFKSIEKRKYLKGSDTKLIKDDAKRAIESLYVEAIK